MKAGNGWKTMAGETRTELRGLGRRFIVLSGLSILSGAIMIPLTLGYLSTSRPVCALVALFTVTLVQLGIICAKYRLEARHRHIEASFGEYFRFNVIEPVFYDIFFAIVMILTVLGPVFPQDPIVFCISMDGILISLMAASIFIPTRSQGLQKKLRPLGRDEHPLVWDAIAKSNTNVSMVGYLELSRLKVANAFQFGGGRNSVIALSSYLEKILNEEETAAVVAHEMGHVAGRHYVKKVLALFVPSLVATNAAALFMVLNAAGPLSEGLQILLLISLAFVAIGFPLLLLPWISRRWETDADMYASILVSPDAMASALAKLAENNLVYGSISKRVEFLLDHPVLDTRIKRISAAKDRKGVESV